MDPSEYMIDFTKKEPTESVICIGIQSVDEELPFNIYDFHVIEKNNVCKSKKRELKGFKKIKSLPPAIRLSLLSLGQKN